MLRDRLISAFRCRHRWKIVSERDIRYVKGVVVMTGGYSKVCEKCGVTIRRQP